MRCATGWRRNGLVSVDDPGLPAGPDRITTCIARARSRRRTISWSPGVRLSLTKMVFTLVCTWIGSGTFIAGAEYAYYAGWSAIWQPAGAFVGIAIIYFVAGRIRTFGQYTVGDILEVRYGRFARLFGAIALIIAFTTIVSYQFRAGGYILNVVTDGRVSLELGQAIAAAFVILFVALGGMVAVAHTDLPNGIIIVVASCLRAAVRGGRRRRVGARRTQVLPPGDFEVFSPDFGRYPALKGLAYFLSTLFLLMGVQSMYQKFYAATLAAPRPSGRGDLDRRHDRGRDRWSSRSRCYAARTTSSTDALGRPGAGPQRRAVHGPGSGRRAAARGGMRGSPVDRDELPAVVELERDARHLPGDAHPNADPDKLVALQKVFIVVMGFSRS